MKINCTNCKATSEILDGSEPRCPVCGTWQEAGVVPEPPKPSVEQPQQPQQWGRPGEPHNFVAEKGEKPEPQAYAPYGHMDSSPPYRQGYNHPPNQQYGQNPLGPPASPGQYDYSKIYGEVNPYSVKPAGGGKAGTVVAIIAIVLAVASVVGSVLVRTITGMWDGVDGSIFNSGDYFYDSDNYSATEEYGDPMETLSELLVENKDDENALMSAVSYWYSIYSPDAQLMDAAITMTRKAELPNITTDLAVQQYIMTGDASHLKKEGNMKPSIYFSREYGTAIEELLEKDVTSVSWLDIQEINYCAIKDGMLHLGITADDEETIAQPVNYSTLNGFYGIKKLLIHGTEGEWQLPFNFHRIEKLAISEYSNFEYLEYYFDEDIHPELKELSLEGSGFKDTIELNMLAELEGLHLSNTRFTAEDIIFPTGLSKLSLLDNRDLTDFSFINQLPELSELAISGGYIRDFSPLYNVKKLELLSINDTTIKDVGFLEGISGIKKLNLFENSELLEIKGLAGLNELEALHISGELKGVDQISQLSQLRKLVIYRPKNLSYLSGLSQLESLTITNPGQLENIQTISQLTALKHLSIGARSITPTGIATYFSLAPLMELSGIETLALSGVAFYGDCSGIFQLSSLTTLNMDYGTFNLPGEWSFSALEKLEKLSLNKARLVNNMQIQSDGFVTSIDYDNISEEELRAKVAGATSLKWLSISNNTLSELDFITGLSRLEYLYLDKNYIIDISPLNELTSLKVVTLRDNPIKNPDALENKAVVLILGDVSEEETVVAV